MLNSNYKKVFLKLSLVVLIYQVIRLCFFLVNKAYFNVDGVGEYLQLIFHSLRFDFSILFIINGIYLVFALFPYKGICQKWYQGILNNWFLLSNTIAFLFDIADIAYFPYQRKRMTAEVFDLMSRKSDFLDLLPSYSITFWYVPLLALVMVGIFIYLNKKINKIDLNIDNQQFSVIYFINYVLILGVAFLTIRGGWQLKPILTSNALSVTTNEKVALVYNTPFSITHTLEAQSLPELSYFTPEELSNYVQPIHVMNGKSKMNNCNIVIIILESFGKSYTGIGGRKSYTPFLDSLMNHGLTFTRSFANANISASGIPAIIGGIPAFMEEPFTTSAYGSNSIDALPKLLKNVGYSSSFFHGGANGTMSFDLFAKNAGFDKYYGRNEYANDADYDGSWGIWDEPYLQYVANELDNAKQPFFSSVFTLSSHQPFHLPKKYVHSEMAKLEGIDRGITYTDMALRKFFETAKSKSWFANTLFVISPDHNFIACHDELGYYNKGFGLYSIPVLFYQPSNPKLQGVDSSIFQQINILPTVLDYVHYPKPYFAFGRSAFDSTRKPFAYNYASHFNQYLVDDYLITANDTSINGLFDFKNDSLQLHNLILNDSLMRVYSPQFKAYLQFLNNSIRSNEQFFSELQ